MFRVLGLIFTVVLFAGASGCTRTPESAAGFRLPDGDQIAGRQEFIDLQTVNWSPQSSIRRTNSQADTPRSWFPRGVYQKCVSTTTS